MLIHQKWCSPVVLNSLSHVGITPFDISPWIWFVYFIVILHQCRFPNTIAECLLLCDTLTIWFFTRISLPCHWICPPRKFTGLPSEKQSARDRSSICHCQQYRIYTFLSATSPFCSRCCQRDGLPEPETGQS